MADHRADSDADPEISVSFGQQQHHRPGGEQTYRYTGRPPAAAAAEGIRIERPPPRIHQPEAHFRREHRREDEETAIPRIRTQERRRFRPGPYRPGEIPAWNYGPGISTFEAHRPEGEGASVVIEAVRRRRKQRQHVPDTFIPIKQPDEDGGHYVSRDPRVREAYPTSENARNTTSAYYSDGLGDAAWRKKKRRRVGLDMSPERASDGGPEPPQHASIICFVTIGGKPEFAEPAAQFGRKFRTKECDDRYFALFLRTEYARIISKARWYGRFLSFKTIAAVEFQTWRLRGSTWSLAEVDSIPETATRATMSHFSYQLRHPFRGGRHWVNKLEKLLKAADRVHANGQPDSGSRWNFRVHIIETIDIQAIYFAVGLAVLPSAAAGIVYGALRDDFSTAFTVASYVLASFSLVFAALATADFLGIETPDSFMASDVYKDLEIIQGYFPGDRKR